MHTGIAYTSTLTRPAVLQAARWQRQPSRRRQERLYPLVQQLYDSVPNAVRPALQQLHLAPREPLYLGQVGAVTDEVAEAGHVWASMRMRLRVGVWGWLVVGP